MKPILSFWWAIGSLSVGTLYIFHTFQPPTKTHTAETCSQVDSKISVSKKPRNSAWLLGEDFGAEQTCAKLEFKIQPVFFVETEQERVK